MKKSKNLLRILYDWVLNWAYSPYGTLALFLIAFAESSFFPIPPDVLLIALSISSNKKAYKFAIFCAIGSVLGGILGYLIGVFFYETVGVKIIEFYHLKKEFNIVGEQYRKNAFLAIFIAGFTPIPYKVFTIAAGVFHNMVPLSILVMASVWGRSLRFFLVATILYFFGEKTKIFIDRYFNLLTIIFAVLLILGFVLIPKIFH